jgi:hypothetical protein
VSHPAYEIPATALFLAAMFLPALTHRTRSLLMIAAWGIFLVGDLLTGQRADAAIDAALIALYAWSWWKGDGWRRKAARLLGAKAKAARDALVRKAREVAQPKPGLRPVPVPR